MRNPKHVCKHISPGACGECRFRSAVKSGKLYDLEESLDEYLVTKSTLIKLGIAIPKKLDLSIKQVYKEIDEVFEDA